MSTNFPASTDSYATKVDNVDKVMAADVNNLQDAVVAIETHLLGRPGENLLYHTMTHDIWAEGVTFNDVTDDTYVATLWNALHNGQAPDVSGETTLIAGCKRDLKCLFDSASSQAAFVHFLNSEDTVPLRGKTLSFSVDTVASGISNLRCAIIEWTGTADSITSDVVGGWGAGNPSLAAGWSYIGTPVDQAISGTTRIKAEGSVVGSTTTNLGVMIWNPAEEGNTDYFAFGKAKLEIGVTATAFMPLDFSQEMDRVSSIYQKSYDIDTAPGTATVTGCIYWQTRTAIAGSVAGTLFTPSLLWKRAMYKTPVVTLYAPSNGASGSIGVPTAGTVRAGATASAIGKNAAAYITISNADADAISLDDVLNLHWVADARL